MSASLRKFRPSWQASLLLGALGLVFVWLGNWQLDRAAQKDSLQAAFEEAPHFQNLPEVAESSRYARVEVRGQFDTERHLLVDNQVFAMRPGVHVLTPFTLTDGRVILINRGWLPLAADRRSLPAVPTSSEITTVSGILDEPYVPGRQLGAPDEVGKDNWPQLVTYPRLDATADALSVPLYPYVLLLEPKHSAGFDDREWKPVQTGAAKHRARALQWFTFLIAALIIWIHLGVRRGAES